MERHMLQIQGILLQYLKLNYPICPLHIVYITIKISHIISCSRFIRSFIKASIGSYKLKQKDMEILIFRALESY